MRMFRAPAICASEHAARFSVASFLESETKPKSGRNSFPFDLLADETSLRLVREFSKIGDVQLRRAAVTLVERMIEVGRA
jgi:hypothetical protein